MRKRIYLAQPISRGEASKNFYLSCEVQCRLVQHGWAPFNPGLSVANFGAQRELDWHDWLYTLDLPWLECADLVLRLPGPSAGAEVELDHARARGIPVVLAGYFECLHDLFDDRRICLPQDAGNLMRWLFHEPIDERLRVYVEEGFCGT